MKPKVAVVHDARLSNEDFSYSETEVKKSVENLFFQLGFDIENHSKEEWNPLGEIISPGNKVVIKPNFVTSRDKETDLVGKYILCSSTNSSVLQPVIEYAWKALEGKGEILVVDSPVEGSQFNKTINMLGVDKLIVSLKEKGINIALLDLRDFKVRPKMLFNDYRIMNRSINLGFLVKKKLDGDPKGYTVVNLGKESGFYELADKTKRLRFHRSHKRTPVKHHRKEINEYSISNTALEADVIINLPKLKTHKKTGVTLSLKSVIGLINKKYWLPHYSAGIPPLGDEYPKKPCFFKRLGIQLTRFPLPFGNSFILRIKKLGKTDSITEGSWPGNDTLWRTMSDINKILFYADKKGNLQETQQRKYLTLIDGVIGGEKEGPLGSSPKRSNTILASLDPVAADTVATRIMGFNENSLNFLSKAKENKKYYIGENDFEQINVIPEENRELNLNFIPPKAWIEHIKLKK